MGWTADEAMYFVRKRWEGKWRAPGPKLFTLTHSTQLGPRKQVHALPSSLMTRDTTTPVTDPKDPA